MTLAPVPTPPTARLLPEMGVSLPVALVRGGMAAVMLALGLAEFGFTPLVVVSIVLGVVTLALPRTPAAWMFILLLAVPLLQAPLTEPSWRLVVAIAGAHVLHQFGTITGWLPEHGRVQRAVLVRSLRTFLVVQVPVQVVAFVIVLVITGTSIPAAFASPAFGVMAGLCLVALVVGILVPILRAARPAPNTED
jgi:hypothetical protein